MTLVEAGPRYGGRSEQRPYGIDFGGARTEAMERAAAGKVFFMAPIKLSFRGKRFWI